MHEDDTFAVFHCVEMHIGDAGVFLRQPGQFKIMRSEQGEGPRSARQMRCTGPGQRQTVKGAGASTNLINQH